MPFAERSQNENCDDGRATGGDERSDEDSQTDRNGTAAGVLDVDQCEADQPSRETSEKNARECKRSGDRGGESGQGALFIHGSIVGGDGCKRFPPRVELSEGVHLLGSPCE